MEPGRTLVSVSRRVWTLVGFAVVASMVVLVPAAPAGAAAAFTLSTTSLDFGSVPVGITKTLPITITNTGDAAGAPNFSGGAPLDAVNFGGSQNCAGKTFQPGDSCRFDYEFHPTTAGVKNSSTTIGIDATNYPITFTGTGGGATTTTTTASTTTSTTTTTRPSGGGGGGGGGGGTATTNPPTTTAAPGEARATVVHTEISPGEGQSATVSGFEPNELVSAVMRSDPIDLGSRVADAQGVVQFDWTIPDGTTPGAHEFVATGATSGTVTVSFTVGEQGDDAGTPWLLIVLGVVALAAVVAAVFFFVRSRRGPTPDTV